MQTPSFEEIVARILKVDQRFDREAFFFVRDALNHTQATVCRSSKAASKTPPRHVRGQELLEGMRQYALSTYGPMAFMLLTEWGVHRCDDFGAIVFLLVEHGALSKTEEDQRSDFQNGYDFSDAFQKPFRPNRAKAPASTSSPQP